MRWNLLFKILLLGTIFTKYYQANAQSFVADSIGDTSSLSYAVNLYHNSLTPETGLYNGSEYPYNTYYPFIINEGDPFFLTKQFSAGSVLYNNVLYNNVPLLFDIIKEELLINDPSKTYIIRLNKERIKWFNISGHTFVKLAPDSVKNASIHAGFYDRLYSGNTALYKKESKTFKENSANLQGVNRYVVESDDYYIKKDNRYYTVKNRKSLLLLLKDKKKELEQFIKMNKLSFRNDEDDALIKITAYYDGMLNNNTKANN